MSIISALLDRKIYGFAQAFGVKDITSPAMADAIRTWFALYFEGNTPKDEDSCQRLPFAVVNKLTKTVFSEYSATIPTKGAKSDFLTRTLGKLDRMKQAAMQQILVGGSCFIKPVLAANGFDFAIIRRDNFLPLSRDTEGCVTSAGTAEMTEEAGTYYTLLERRTVTPDGVLTIESRLYRSGDRVSLGSRVGLHTIEKYAQLEPVLVLPGILNLGMAEVKTPVLNCVDGSPDGVSVYAPAVELIQNINRNERQLCDEFQNGASRIIASADMLDTDRRGRKHLSDKLFVAVDDDPGNVGVTIFSPALREASYLARKNEYLRNIETLIGFKRGILSEVEAAERTATEITSSAGDYNLTILDFQQMWERALRELLATCDRLGQLYRLCDSSAFDPEKDLVVDWGDGVLFDRTRTWAEYLQMVQAGLLKPELALAWYFNLPHETPAELDKIRTNYMPELDTLLGGDA